MTRILLDTNVILDIALNRQPYVKEAAGVFALLGRGEVEGFVSASAITDIYYITRKAKGAEDAKAFIRQLLSLVRVAGVDQNVIQKALSNAKRITSRFYAEILCEDKEEKPSLAGQMRLFLT